MRINPSMNFAPCFFAQGIGDAPPGIGHAGQEVSRERGLVAYRCAKDGCGMVRVERVRGRKKRGT